MTFARLPQRILKRGLRYIFYLVLSLLCLFLTFAVGTAPAQAADDGIDLVITTLSANQVVTLPLGGIAFTNATMDWGDPGSGTANTKTIVNQTDTTDMQHTFSTVGAHTVRVGITIATGSFRFGNAGAVWPGGTNAGYTYLTGVTSIGSKVTSLSGAFFNCTSLSSVPNTLPTTVTDLSFAFAGASTFNDSNISTWNTSAVQNFASMFSGATLFNQDLSSWDTHAATNMSSMFLNATSFNNGNASGVTNSKMNTSSNLWNVGLVTNFT